MSNQEFVLANVMMELLSASVHKDDGLKENEKISQVIYYLELYLKDKIDKIKIS